MQIIDPSFEIIDMPDGADILKRIELAGRVCYKSEGKITDDSAEAFVRRIIKSGHHSVLEHVTATVRIICDRGVTHELVRHRLASFCVTGDTIIPSYVEKKGRSAAKRTIKYLYKQFQRNMYNGARQSLRVRSIDESTLTIVPNKILNVFYNGKQDVFQLETESGRIIKATGEHRFLSEDGWKTLSTLNIGDKIYANGMPLLNNEDWIRHNYLTLNKTRAQVAAEIGCCEATLFKAFKRFGIFKPWSDRPNRHAGYGKKGMFTKEVLERLSNSKKGEKNPKYKVNRDELTRSGGYIEANKKYSQKKQACELCGGTNILEIHHVDKNPKNNDEQNIKILCSHCHHLWHKPMTVGAFLDKIINIKHIGKEDVYDLEMAAPYHNYVANGLVVHNSQESSRYCDYSNDKFGSEITVIRPMWWDTSSMEFQLWQYSMKEAADAYMSLLEQGATPQQARTVLPNSLKTEIVVTANMREWRHIFSLRCDTAAHPQMRQVMIPIMQEFHKRCPAMFDDMEVCKNNVTDH